MIRGHIYILSNFNRTVLYIGVTCNLRDRILRHKVGYGSKFASRYKCTDLLYYEDFPDMIQAITREKQLKNWKREWKVDLIKGPNPGLIDLASDWFDEETLESAEVGFKDEID